MIAPFTPNTLHSTACGYYVSNHIIFSRFGIPRHNFLLHEIQNLRLQQILIIVFSYFLVTL